MSSNNPLQKYFRQPQVYMSLPSRGRYYPPGCLNTEKDLPVMPMTANDEINMRVPDALYSGVSMVNLIKSCIPDIRDPWTIPMTDFDSILIAIKIASFGNELDIETVCPNCGEDNNFRADLSRILSSIKFPDYDQEFSVGELIIFYRPLNYRQATENSLWQVNQQRRIQAITESTELSEEDKTRELSTMMSEISQKTIDSIVASIDCVKTPETVVQDRAQIKEFLVNCGQDLYSKIRDRAVEIREKSEVQPFDIVCGNCQTQYQQPFLLDMSNFFVSGS